MKRFTQRLQFLLQDFFGVSPKEARGIAFLLCFSLGFLVFPIAFQQWVLPLTVSPDTEVPQQLLDSLLKDLAPRNTPPAARDTTPATVSLQPFNPNTASEDELKGVGIPSFLARRIVHYRTKGGKFRDSGDLRKIYDFPDTLFRKLQPYVVLRPPVPDKKPGTVLSSPKERAQTVSPTPPVLRPAAHPLVPFDINTADSTQLIRLKGIGSGRARIILNFRNALGGFHSTKQFEEIYGMDSTALSQLQQYARILSPVRQLPVNTIPLTALLQHPYARGNKRWATLLIRYRDQHGPFASAEDFNNIRAMDPDFMEKLTPYLHFD